MRPTPAETATSLARSRRERAVRLSSLSSLTARGVAMAVAFLSVPLMARYLSAERYGFFLTATALATWLNLADLGLGNGLTNRIAEAAAREDRESEGRVFSSALAIVTSVCLALGLLVLLTFSLVPSRSVFGVSTLVGDTELHATLVVVFGLWLLSIPLGLVEKAYAGYQQIYVNNVWTAAAGVASLLALGAAVALGASLPWVVAAVHAPLPVARLASGAVLLFRRRWLVPRLSSLHWTTGRRLLLLGSGFLVAQLAAIGMWQADQIVLAQLFGAEAVAPYVTTLRVVTLYVGLLMTWLAPLWPASTDAASRGDWAWISTRYARALKIAMGATVLFSVVVLFGGRWAIGLWAGDRVVPTQALIQATAVYVLVLVWCQVHSVFLSALGRARGQAMYGLLAAGINIGASIVLGRAWGVAGVCWATSIASVPILLLAFVELRLALKRRSP